MNERIVSGLERVVKRYRNKADKITKILNYYTADFNETFNFLPRGAQKIDWMDHFGLPKVHRGIFVDFIQEAYYEGNNYLGLEITRGKNLEHDLYRSILDSFRDLDKRMAKKEVYDGLVKAALDFRKFLEVGTQKNLVIF